MSRYLFATLLLLPAGAMASSPFYPDIEGNETSGSVKVLETGKDFTDRTVKPLPLNGDLGEVSSPAVNVGEEKGPDPAPFTPMWGADILIRSANTGTPAGIKVASAPNGDIYAAVLMRSSAWDTVEIWKSTDGGSTWTRQPQLDVHGDIDFRGFDMVIGPGSNPWMFIVVDYDSSSFDALYSRRITLDGSSPTWIKVVDGDTVRYPSISVNSTNQLVLSYITDNDRVYRGASTDTAQTWTLVYANSNVQSSDVHVSENGRGYHTYITTDSTVWLVTFNLPSLGASSVDQLSEGNDIRHISVAASNGSVSSQHVTVVWSNYHSSTDKWDVHYTYSTDGGAAWSTASPFPPTNFLISTGAAMYYPTLAYEHNADAFRFVATLVSSWDTVIYALSTGADSWPSGRTFLNDYNATTSFPASVGYSSTLSGGFVIYRQYASDNVWFDRWTTPTDVAEKVIRADNFNLNGRTLTTSHPVRIYSVSGRLVGEGTGTFTLKPGMYLITHENGTSKLVVR